MATNGTSNGKPYRSSIQVPTKVALSPNDAESVPSTIEKINSLGKSFSREDNAGRLELLTEARRLVRALEMPRETMIKHNWAQVSFVQRTATATADMWSLLRTARLPLVSTSACFMRCWRTTLRRSWRLISPLS